MSFIQYKKLSILMTGSRVAVGGGYRYTFDVPAELQGQSVIFDDVWSVRIGDEAAVPAQLPPMTKYNGGPLLMKYYNFKFSTIFPYQEIFTMRAGIPADVLGATFVINVYDGDVLGTASGATFNANNNACCIWASIFYPNVTDVNIKSIGGLDISDNELPVSIAQTVNIKDVNL